MFTRSLSNFAGGALVLLALACPTPAAAASPDSGLVEIPDSELAHMRGRYTVAGNSVAWFGVTMISTWTDAAGRTLEGGMTLGMDFRDGGNRPRVSFTPVVSITDADAPVIASGDGGSRHIDGAGLANASGLVQGVQIAGDRNTASNLAHLRVREGTEAPAGAAPLNGNDLVSRVGNASVLAGFDGNTARVKLQIEGQGAVEQWIRSGSVGQLVQLTGDGHNVNNRLQLDLVQQPAAAEAMLAQNVAQAMVLARGIGPGI